MSPLVVFCVSVVFFAFLLWVTRPKKILLVGNCKKCRVHESVIDEFPGTVVRFNGANGARADIMIWANDLYSKRLRAGNLALLNVFKHRLRSWYGGPVEQSSGFLAWLYYVSRGYDVYCTGFDFGDTVSESSKKYGTKTASHNWEREKRVAKSDPAWKTLS